MTAPEITPDVYLGMGLTEEEYQLIVALLGRAPGYVELGMASVMWSEHCGYKHSRHVLAKFGEYKKALEGAGLENAGVVDIGGGLGATFKVESHNHPSAVEPYQGAATGVGGIIRDVLTMGARPIAMLNSLRFGPIHGDPAEPVVVRNRHLMEHVVAGIAGYGNCVGVPTVAGEIGVHPRYSENPLVNAMCVGVVPLANVTTAAASGVGNPVLYFGSATGRDGIHGATFASTELDAESEAKRPNVQIGDPFAEKLLIEATLELLATGAVVAIQDMGAAGLTCSTTEMASQGGVGMTIDLDLVPMRENDMEAYELMLSESQERMLAVVQKGREEEALEVLRRWEVPAAILGEVTADGRLVITRRGETVCDLDPGLLTEHCPGYQIPGREPARFAEDAHWDHSVLDGINPRETLLLLLAHPDVCDKRWIYRQFDQQVQTQTVVAFGDGDAAVLAPRGTSRGIAVAIDGNARWAERDPYVGGLLAVCEAARNVACSGARPVAATDGLNWGSPKDPEISWSFERCVQGLADAAEGLGTPVLSGNVSFYNQGETLAIPPTPIIGMLGVIEDPSKAVASFPKEPCEVYALRGVWDGIGLGASLVAELHGYEAGRPVAPSLAKEVRLHRLLERAASEGLLLFAHDSSDGGEAVALAEICLRAGLGGTFDIGPTPSELFGERPGVVFVGVTDHERFSELCFDREDFENDVLPTPVGTLDRTDRFVLGEISWSLAELDGAYRGSWPL